MSVRVWAGTGDADHHSEVLALQKLADLLRDQATKYYVFWNFRLPGRQIDMLLMQHDRIFCLELKSGAGKPILGSMNGRWTRADGVSLGAPVPQLLAARNQLRDWLYHNSQRIWSENEIAALDLQNFGIRSFVVVYPVLHPDSKIYVAGEWRLEPPHGGVIGFDDVLRYVTDAAFAGRMGVPLQERHVEKMAELLGLWEVADVRSLEPVRQSGDTLNVAPHKPHARKRWLILFAGTAALFILALLIYPWKDQPLPDRPVGAAEETPVYVHELKRSDIGKEITMLLRIDEIHRRGDAVFMFTSVVPRGSFSIEVRSNSPVADSERLSRFEGQWVILGPVKITSDRDGDPQVEFATVEEALRLIRLR
jgi:hypothetical protein